MDVETTTAAPGLSRGIQELIERLKQEGIEAGQVKAKQVEGAAQEKARRLVADARQEADLILAQAREEAARTKATGQEALRIAARDTLLALKNEAAQVFRNELRKQVSAQFQQEAFLRDLLLQVCKRQIPELEPGQEMRVLLPERLVNLEDLRRVNDAPEEELLAQFVASLFGGPLREGVTFGRTNEQFEGIKVALVDQQLMIDLTDHAIAALLSQYLLPRFRAVLEGYLQ